MGWFSSSVELLAAFQFTDVPDVYLYLVRVYAGTFTQDFLRVSNAEDDAVVADTPTFLPTVNTYTRCFIVDAADKVWEKRLYNPSRYALEQVVRFVDGEEITISPDWDQALYKYRRGDEETHALRLQSVRRTPDLAVMHERFRTERPQNHAIDGVYARVRAKQPPARTPTKPTRHIEQQATGWCLC